MKNRNLMFLIGLLSGIVVSVLLALLIAPKVLFIESESKYDFDKTSELIISGTTENGWAMPNQYDLQKTMEKHGFDVKPVKVFSICQPQIAHNILGSNDQRVLSAMMPCRVAVYQKKDGKTYISRMNAGFMSKLLGSKVKKTMKAAGEGSEKIIEPLID